MDYHQKIAHWSKDQFPRRLMLSGFGASLDTALEIAARLQGVSVKDIAGHLHADTLVLNDDGQSFKVGDDHRPDKNSARGLVEWINQTPVSPYRIVILEHIERASNTALQALLKVLEEPPKNAQFLITTSNHHRLLPTIISRVTTLMVPHNLDAFPISVEAKDFLENSNPLPKFKLINELRAADKDEARSHHVVDFVDNLLLHARFFPQYQIHLEKIYQARQHLQQNVNAKLVLERLAIALSQR